LRCIDRVRHNRAVGSADNRTGYVFGLHLNFDPSLNPDDIERDAIASGDYEVKPAYKATCPSLAPTGLHRGQQEDPSPKI